MKYRNSKPQFPIGLAAACKTYSGIADTILQAGRRYSGQRPVGYEKGLPLRNIWYIVACHHKTALHGAYSGEKDT